VRRNLHLNLWSLLSPSPQRRLHPNPQRPYTRATEAKAPRRPEEALRAEGGTRTAGALGRAPENRLQF